MDDSGKSECYLLVFALTQIIHTAINLRAVSVQILHDPDNMNGDLLDSVLDLEDASYQAGFDEGQADGVEAGYTEGRVFGIEKGYQKGLEMGKLHGRALMLNACLSHPNPIPKHATDQTPVAPATATVSESKTDKDNTVPFAALPENPRLKKHVETLLKLTDPNTLSAENSELAVEDFDGRLKKAIAKAKIIDKLIAEPYNMISGEATNSKAQPPAGTGNIEELSSLAASR